MNPSAQVVARRGHEVPSRRVLPVDERSVPVGTNGYTTSWGPSLSGCPSEL